jgi:hypothetical protein
MLVVALLLGSVPAFAANARLERVVLLPSPDRSSVVVELTAEPSHVSTRRISESVLEVEAGPGIDAAPAQILKAPANVRFIDSVSIRVLSTDAGSMVRARITLTASARAVVRSAGRRVYVDVSAPPAPASPAVQTATTRPARADAPPGPPVASPPGAPDDAYKTGVRPVLARLAELRPFLTSAARSGDRNVTTAVLPTLTAVRSSLAALQPPAPARGSHTMVLAAVDRIIKALAPDFAGDRVDAVRQSMTTIDVVGTVLVE